MPTTLPKTEKPLLTQLADLLREEAALARKGHPVPAELQQQIKELGRRLDSTLASAERD